MSASEASLLIELRVEELPPKALRRLGDAFAQAVLASLKQSGLLGDQAQATAFATPRRLAAHVTHVHAQAADKAVEHKLMPVSVALDAQGGPTPALQKKLAALGAAAVPVAALARRGEGKAEALVWQTTQRGASLAQGVQVALDAALASLPIPKVMSYQLADGWTSVSFVRPAHGLVVLHGSDVVPAQALGLVADRQTQGHRFEASVNPIPIESADQYADTLTRLGAVVPGFAQRRASVEQQLQQAAQALGLNVIDDDALLDEVTALVERPNVLTCRFEPAFLAVPPECLILTMKANQKYFPLLDAQGQLTNTFLVVSNIAPADPRRIIEGNERVVRPRLADAKFFFDKDRKTSLESRLPMLDKVVYHAKLGSIGDRVRRVTDLALALATAMAWPEDDKQKVRAAAQLAKADLVTDMVGEFPELQGIMGGYYARNDGHDGIVAQAIEDHYKPRFAGDALPRHAVGVVVALADKLETLVGLFAAGERPSGDKDPFALRRQALGVIRLLMESGLPIELSQALSKAAAGHPAVQGAAMVELRAFVGERLAGLLRDMQFSTQEVDSVLSLDPQRMADVPKRLEAVRAFAQLSEAASLAAANKRVGNILKKSEAAIDPPASAPVNPNLLQEAAEQHLHGALANVKPLALGLLQNGEYAASLRELAALKGPVDAFFEQVMVNVDDVALRQNRLALLGDLHRTMNQVADLAKLAS